MMQVRCTPSKKLAMCVEHDREAMQRSHPVLGSVYMVPRYIMENDKFQYIPAMWQEIDVVGRRVGGKNIVPKSQAETLNCAKCTSETKNWTQNTQSIPLRNFIPSLHQMQLFL